MFSNFVTFRQCVYEKLEKQPPCSLWARPRRLLIRHCASKSGMSAPLCHVIVRERGTLHASSFVTQQEFVEFGASSALNSSSAEWYAT